MEQSTYRGYTVATLAKIAAAAGARLEVRFVPRGRRLNRPEATKGGLQEIGMMVTSDPRQPRCALV